MRPLAPFPSYRVISALARRMAKRVALALLLSSATLAPAHAAQWMDVATISSTMGNNAGYVCTGAGKTDLGCPLSAPYVNAAGYLGIGTNAPIGLIDISGTVGRVNIANSGASLNFTRSGTSYIQANDIAGALGFVTGGSATRVLINAAGSVAINGTNPRTLLDVSGTLKLTDGGEACDTLRTGSMKYSGGQFYICQNTTNGWESLATTGANSLSDRITSNSQAGVIANATGYISLTTGGVTGTAYFTPGAIMVAGGVSTTSGISGTDGYFARHLSVGAPFPSGAPANVTLNVLNTLQVQGTNKSFVVATNGGGVDFASQNAAMYINNATTSNTIINGLGTGLLGVHTLDPSTTLHVNGTLRIADGGETCDINRIGAIKYTSGAFYICQNPTNGWESLSTGTSAITTFASLTDISYSAPRANVFGPGSLSGAAAGNTSSTAFGYGALANASNNSTGNSAFGAFAMNANTTGARNTALGRNALAGNTSGQNNVAVGTGSMLNNTIGTNNVAVGQSTLMAGGISNSSNVAVGWSALSNNTVDFNTAVGYNAMAGSTNGNGNTAFGASAMKNLFNGASNVSIGAYAGLNLTTGSNNVLIGTNAGPNLTTGWYNIMIGNNVSTTSGVNHYQLDIGDTIYGDLTNSLLQTARIGINAQSPTTALQVSGTLRMADGGESCDTNRVGAMKYSSGAFYICQNTTNGWEPLATSGATSLADRITSNSQAGVIANATGYISLTTGGVTGTAYFTPNAVLVNGGVSATGSISATTGYFVGNVFAGSYVNSGFFRGFSGSGGTASNPVFSINSQSTGMYFPGTAANQSLAFSTSATEALRIVSTGYVGIGTTAPSSTLHLLSAPDTTGSGLTIGANNGTAANRLQIMPSGGASVLMKLNNSGNMTFRDNNNTPFSIFDPTTNRVGIGSQFSVVPSTTLHVSGTLEIANGGETCDTNRLGAIRYAAGSFDVCRNTTNGWEPLSTSTSSTTPSISTGASGSLVYRNEYGYLYATNTLSISSTTGSVGIGAGAPGNLGSNALYAAGSIRTDYGMYARVVMQFTQTTASNINWNDTNTAITGDYTNRFLSFTPSGTEALRIVSTGYVGIGTSTPVANLDISGTSTSLMRLGNATKSLMVSNNSGSGIDLTTNSSLFINNGLAQSIFLNPVGSGKINLGGSSNKVAIGLGTGDASTTLHVSGTLEIANGGESCDTSRLGAMRYAGGSFDVCRTVANGWEPLSTSTSSTTPSISTGASGSLVYRNEYGYLYATNTLSISSTTGSVGIGAGPPASVGNNGLYVAGNVLATNYTASGNAYFNTGAGIQWSSVGNSITSGNATGPSLAFGVSGTNAVTIVSSSSMGIGLLGAVPSATLHISGTFRITDSSNASYLYLARNSINTTNATFYINTDNNSNLNNVTSIGNVNAKVGIGMINALPSTTLEVSGTLKVRDGGDACDTNRLGALKYTSGAFYICQNVSNGWEPLATSGATSLADRITSNSQAGVIANATGYISLTTGGVTGTVYFDRSGVLVNAGVSTTGPISGTNLYASGQVYSDGNVNIASGRYLSWGGLSKIYGSQTNSNLQFLTSNNVQMSIVSTGLVGIGTTTPSTTFQVSGTIRMADGGETCDTNRLGALKYTAGAFYICQNVSNGWEPLATSGASANTDRITSNSQAGVIANATGYISLTTGGVTGTAYFTPNAVLVNGGVSASGAISGTFGYFANTVGIGTLPGLSPYSLTTNWAVRALNGGFLAPAGNASGPTFVFSADTHTGMFRAAQDTIGFSTSSTEVMRLTSDSRVAIGTTTPIATLTVSGSLLVSSSTATGGLYVSGTTGSVGIGTSTPIASFQVMGNAQISNIYMNGPEIISRNSSTGNYLTDFYVATSQPNNLVRLAGLGGKVAVGMGGGIPATALDISGTLKMRDGGETCTAATLGAMRYVSGTNFQICQTAANGWEPLATATSSSTPAISTGLSGSIVYRDQNGYLQANSIWYVSNTNIGLGSMPSYVGALTNTIWTDNGFLTNGGIRLGNSQKIAWGNSSNYLSGADSTSFNYIALTTSGTEALRIVSTGYVGIGTTTPSTSLDVSGSLTLGGIGNYNPLTIRRPTDGLGLGTLGYADAQNFRFTNTSGSGYFTWLTNNGTTAERMRLDNNGYLGIGTTAPSNTLHLIGNMRIGPTNGANLTISGSEIRSLNNGGGGSLFLNTTNNAGSTYLGGPSGTIGIAIASSTPSNTLHVNGAIRMADDGTTCDTNRLGAIKYASGSFSICQNVTNGWEPLSTSGVSSTIDRIISGTTQAIAYNNTSLSLVTAGTERMVIGTSGIMGIAQQPVAGQALSISGTTGITGRLNLVTAVSNNILIGSNNNPTTANSTFIGGNAGQSASGNDIVGVGLNTARYNTGAQGTFIGNNAGTTNTGSNTTAIGYSAAVSNSGANLTAVGYNAGNNNSGASVLALGYNSAVNNSGANTTSVGVSSAASNTGQYLVAVGQNAGQNNTQAAVTTIGYSAGQSNTGASLSAFGYQAGQNNSGINSTVMGYLAAQNNSGVNTIALGYAAAQFNTGNNLMAVGFQSGQSNTGSNNTAAGNYAMQYKTAGAGNTIFGTQAGQGVSNSTSYSNNSLFGAFSGAGLTTGGSNTLIGYNSGAGITTGSNNLILGASTSPYSNTADNQLNIANAIFGNYGAPLAALIGINVVSPTANLEVSGTISATALRINGVPFTGTSNADRITSGTTVAIAYNNTSISLVTGGAERMVIGTNGGVAIAQQPMTGFALAISGSAYIRGGLDIQTTGTSNTFVGTYAGNNVGLASAGTYSHTGIGVGALQNASGTAVTAVGYQAGQNNNSSFSTLIGGFAGQYNGQTNLTSVGYSAGQYNSGPNSTLMGMNAGNSNSGSHLTAIGFLAGLGNTGGNNTLIGAYAGQSGTGSNLTAIGYQAGMNNSGTQVISIGSFAGQYNTAFNLSAIGYAAGQNNSGSELTVFGSNAAVVNSGSGNTAVGSSAMQFKTGGNYNVAMGYNAGLGVSGTTNYSRNTLLGAYAGNALTTGSSNTIIGYNTGAGITTGTDNILLGANLSPLSNTGSYQLNIGNAIMGDIGNPLAAKIGINVTSPTYNLDVSGTFRTTTGANYTYINGAGIHSLNGMYVNTDGNTGNTNTWIGRMSGGRVGIAMPSAALSSTLQVSGTIQFSDSGDACDTNRKGAIRYTSASTFQTCDGTTGWQTLGSASATSSSGDRITSGTTSIIANNNGAISFTTAGTQRMVINTAGEVGINTTPVSGYALAITGKLSVQTSTSTSMYIGSNAGLLATGSFNTGLGANALGYSANSGYNTAVGNAAGQNNTGSYSTFVGNGAGLTNTADNVVAVGNQAGGANKAGNLTAVGASAGYSNLASGTTTIGNLALYNNTTGLANTAVGYSVMQYITTGSGNTALGYLAGLGTGSSNFSGNTLLGAYAGTALTTGSSNTLVGYNVGAGITTGINNLLIGTNLSPFSNTGSNQLNIAGAIFGDYGALLAAKIGINVTSPTTALEVSGTIKTNAGVQPGNADQTCATSADYGKMRFDQSTGRLYLCRP